MRTLIACGLATLFVSCTARTTGPASPSTHSSRAPDADELATVLYFLDGRTVSSAHVQSLPRDSIADIQLLKGGAAVERFGFAGYPGVLLVTTTRPQPAPNASSEPNLYVFINGRTASRDDLMKLARESIRRIEVLKGPNAITMYGPNSRDGVVLVSTKAR